MPKIIIKKILYHKVKIIHASHQYARFIHKGFFRKD